MLHTKWDRWDSLVEQYKREHPDKINKNPSADVRKKRKGRGKKKEDSKSQNQN